MPLCMCLRVSFFNIHIVNHHPISNQNEATSNLQLQVTNTILSVSTPSPQSHVIYFGNAIIYERTNGGNISTLMVWVIIVLFTIFFFRYSFPSVSSVHILLLFFQLFYLVLFFSFFFSFLFIPLHLFIPLFIFHLLVLSVVLFTVFSIDIITNMIMKKNYYLLLLTL